MTWPTWYSVGRLTVSRCSPSRARNLTSVGTQSGLMGARGSGRGSRHGSRVRQRLAVLRRSNGEDIGSSMVTQAEYDCGAMPRRKGDGIVSDVLRTLQDMADLFVDRIAEDFALRVQIDLQPDGGSWQVVVESGCRVTVSPGPDQRAQVILVTTEEILERIHSGQMAALTAAAKGSISDPAPLDYRLGEEQSFTPQLYADMLVFLQRFFNCTEPERILLGEAHSRKVHGANVVALFYQPGFRSAWYLVKKGDQLNESGDTNPFPQAFVFISGDGWAKIGEQTLPVRAGEAYFVPPGSEHIVWTERDEPLILLWLAWGEGA